MGALHGCRAVKFDTCNNLVWTNDHKLLQKSNYYDDYDVMTMIIITEWQPCKALIMSFVLFNQCHDLVNGRALVRPYVCYQFTL